MKFKTYIAGFSVTTLVAGVALSSLVWVKESSAKDPGAREWKFAIVDVQKSLVSVDMGKKAKAELEKEINNRQKAIEAEKKTFEKLRDDYTKRSSVMSDDARKKKEEELQKEYMKIQMDQAQLPEIIKKKEVDLTTPIYNKLKVVMDETKKKGGYNIIFEKSATPSFDPDLEITDEIITTFDKQYKATGDLK